MKVTRLVSINAGGESLPLSPQCNIILCGAGKVLVSGSSTCGESESREASLIVCPEEGGAPPPLPDSAFPPSLLFNGMLMKHLDDPSRFSSLFLSMADSGSENPPQSNPLKRLDAELSHIGSDSDGSGAIGSLLLSMSSLENDIKSLRERRERFVTISTTIAKLEKKLSMLMKDKIRTEDSIPKENAARLYELLKEYREHSSRMRENEARLKSLKESKESVTQKASALREALRDYEYLLTMDNSILTLINEYESIIIIKDSSSQEKEHLKAEILDKEKELQSIISHYTKGFEKYSSFEEFDSLLTTLERSVSRAKIINEKWEVVEEKEQEAKRLRGRAISYLIPAYFFTLLVVALGSAQIHTSFPMLEVPLLVSSLACIFMFYEFYKYNQQKKRFVNEMNRGKKEIMELKSDIDKSKEALSEILKEAGVTVSFDLRTRFREFQGAKKDLDSLSRITRSFDSDESETSVKTSSLEMEIRKILEKSGVLSQDAPVSAEVIGQFKENYRKAQALQQEQEFLRIEYRRITDDIERESPAKSQLDKTFQGASAALRAMLEDKSHALNEDMVKLLELDAVISDYQAVIHEMEERLPPSSPGEKSLPELDEELDSLRNRVGELKQRREAVALARSILEEARRDYLSGDFIPRLKDALRSQCSALPHPSDEKLIESLMPAGGDLEAALESSEPSRLFYHALIVYGSILVTIKNEQYPLFLDDILSTDGPLPIEEAVRELLDLSKAFQIVCLTKEKALLDRIKGALTAREAPYDEREKEGILVITTR
ncbi:MAG: hypothetical protein RDV48_16845 [Candidatus Eremiobacteraeota bacterium]|nr:hypothetical protein [Candidatus Eremiobacteraeota bacterium]